MVHMPYRGIAPAFTDLIGGQTQAMFPGLAAAVPHIRSGRVRPLAVTGLARHPQFKDMPDAGRVGLQGLRRAAVVRRGRPGRHAARRRQAAQRHAGRGADRARPAREAVDRGGRAQPDEPGEVRRVHARRHRALDRSWPRRATSSSTTDHLHADTHPMARNTQVAADHNAPPVTQMLAGSSPTIPRRGWSDAVDHEAHRTFLNWVGCAVGAAHHETAQAALGAVQVLQPAAQASMLGRSERVDMASAALINGISSHTFDFDDTHLKTIIHPAGPVASAVLALAEHTGAQRPRADRRAGAGHRRELPRRQRDVPRPLRPRLAHHRQHRHAGRGRGLRAPAEAGRAARPRWRWASPRRSRSACASSSAP